ncbi:G2 M phase-specific E3 ubiquitin- ligase-like [Paramuricea clavata]|uniref:G2 M phase-specific E3 ubiquitin- ligase-like n=1 Tax=Paramuricea clavata TaxID=317549 RepID=A0A7D9IMM4_PARCT|nr:G2 M phase-specific E3 ubiquitin- ligase-like [Paramuricea clavata]
MAQLTVNSTASTTPRTAENTTISSSSSSSTTSVGPSTSGSRTHNELQTLFPHHFSSNSRSASYNRNRSNSRKRKRKSITRKFVCLADKEQYEIPDREEQRELLVAGLGEVKIAVPEHANEKDVRDLLIETFAKLKDCGGFELMYAETRSKDLLLIPLGPDGLSMKYIASFIGQGRIYIRPIQQDLPLGEDSPSAVTHKEECRNCHDMVDLISLRDHYKHCKTKDEDSENDVDDSVLEIPAFGLSSVNSDNDLSPVQTWNTSRNNDVPPVHNVHIISNNDVSPVESLHTSNIAAQRSQACDEEYENYVEIIDDELSEDNEDPELIEAIEASLAEVSEQKNGTLEDESYSVQSILGTFQTKNLDYTESEANANITISRKAIFATARKAIDRRRFSFLKPVFVTFAGEEAVDEGGPKREFFRLLMREICDSSIFHGSWFSHDLGLLADNRYELAGKLVAWSILHGGSGPRCLSVTGFDFRTSVEVNHKVAIESVADHEMKEILGKAVECSTEETFSALVTKYGDKIAQYRSEP